MSNYLHGYSKEEQDRLLHQAEMTENTIYQSIDFSDAKHVLEVGSGVGAQTEILLRRYPKLNLTCVDLNESQIEVAKEYLKGRPHCHGRYDIKKMNAEHLDFDTQFDGAFLCWVLEHVPEPKKILSEVRRVLKPGSQIYITEVMNSSFFLDPYSPHVWKYWMAFNDFQLEQAGDPFVGAKLGNLLLSQGYKNIYTKVKNWHFDNRKPQHRTKFLSYWKDLLLSASDILVKNNCVTEEDVRMVSKELNEVGRNPDAVFSYSFMQAQAEV